LLVGSFQIKRKRTECVQVVKDLDPFELGDGEIGENGCL